MRLTAIAAALFAVAVIAAPGHAASFTASSLSDAHLGTSKAELLAQRDFSARMIRRLSHSWRPALRHRSCWSHVPWARACDQARRRLLRHRWLHALAVRKLAQLYPAPAIAHLAGWECITNGAYPGAPHEGDGVNGSYSGPLGMTDPWMGYSGSWVAMPRDAVYAIAEKVAAVMHFDPGWMRGQWPNTYPPCAGRF